MKPDTRYPLALARSVAQEVAALLRPGCARIDVAGSIRRQKPDIGDCELLVIPAPWGVFEYFLSSAMDRGILTKRLNKNGHETFGRLNKLMVHVPSGIGIDLFSTTPENWGMALVVRTGPSEWNIAMMAAFQRLGTPAHAYGGVTVNGTEVECPTEQRVFDLLGIPYLQPGERTPQALSHAGRAAAGMTASGSWT